MELYQSLPAGGAVDLSAENPELYGKALQTEISQTSWDLRK